MEKRTAAIGKTGRKTGNFLPAVPECGKAKGSPPQESGQKRGRGHPKKKSYKMKFRPTRVKERPQNIPRGKRHALERGREGIQKSGLGTEEQAPPRTEKGGSR